MIKIYNIIMRYYLAYMISKFILYILSIRFSIRLKILGCTVNMTAFLSMALILKHYKYINLNMNGLSKTHF